MSNDGFIFQASVKDSDGDMVNVRAESAAELETYLLNFPSAAYAQFKANVRGGSSLGQIVAPAQPQQAAPNVQQQWPSDPPAVQPAWSQPQQQAAPAQQGGPVNGTPHPEGKVCQVDGVPVVFKRTPPRRSDNKTFDFWSCPNQKSKGDGHFSEFAN